ncbi:MAG TPA: glycosyltransferase family 1 protein [Pontiella sp.]
MRIGVSTFALAQGRSGVSTYIRELLRALQLEDSENSYDLFMTNEQAAQIPLTNPNFTRSIFPAVVGRPLLNQVWHNAVPAVRRKAYDVLHIPTARRIPLIKSTKTVATVHDMAAFSVKAKYDPARTLFNRHLIPAMIRRADHVIAVSHSTRNDIIRFTGLPEDRISVIYSGIDHDLFRPVSPADARRHLHEQYGMEKPFLLYVSRIEHPAKNHVRLIEAFERFKLENDSAHQLVLAGADWHGAQAVKARAAASPVKDDIRFPGFVPAGSLPALYSGCDLMVFPSLFEGFGFPVIEALACGAPVICSGTSSMIELAGDLIPTFDPFRAETIFEGLEQALSTGQSKEMKSRGMEHALGFDWRKTAGHVMEVYRSLS